MRDYDFRTKRSAAKDTNITISPTRVTLKVSQTDVFHDMVYKAVIIAAQVPADYPRTLRGTLYPDGSITLRDYKKRVVFRVRDEMILEVKE